MIIENVGSNQTQVTLNSGTVVFFSYNTPVAAKTTDGNYLRTNKKWSVTTTRHINSWLRGIIAQEVDQSVMDGLTA